MCGISGYWHKGIRGKELQSFLSSLVHRGPDGSGHFIEGNVLIAHNRLSIIDLIGGNQPLFNEDRSIVVVYNGEIYNYLSLRKELLRKGHRFMSNSDTEVLVHSYEEYGPKMMSFLRGMFSFALFDRGRREILLARDPFGIKPLVYAELPEGFIFSSELRTLLSFPKFPRVIDSQALQFYLAFNYIPAPYTIWKFARRLEPGFYIRVKDGKIIEKKRYFYLKTLDVFKSIGDAMDELKNVLEDSIKSHLISDVPIGAFLSGGLDSSLVCAIAQRVLNKSLRTFTVTFPEWHTYDEAQYARRVAHHIGTSHQEIPVTSLEAQGVLKEIVNHLDEPFADSSLVNVAIVSKVARSYVKVTLSGDGGDEFFAGYNKYQGLILAGLLNNPALGMALKAILRIPLPEQRGSVFGDKVRQLRKLSRLIGSEAFSQYFKATLSSEPDIYKKLTSLIHSNKSVDIVKDVLRKIWQDAQKLGFDNINLWLWNDTNFVLPYDMLHKVDVASMKYSLEVRVPLVDIKLAQLVFSFPGKWKLRGLERKWILKKVATFYLPPEIINRPKGGFGIPIGEWMRDEMRPFFEEYLLTVNEKIWNKKMVYKLWKEHLERRRDRFWELWNVFVFEVWRRNWKPEFDL